MSGFTYLPQDCRRCGYGLGTEDATCPNCGDERGFRFPIFHSLAIAVFVAGALAYHFYPEVGATLIRLAGYGDTIPQH